MSACAPPIPSDEAPAGDWAEAVRRCLRQPAFLAELERLYREVDRLAARGGGRCWGGGGCCQFDLAGHRLYLTAGELALLTQAPPPPPPAARGPAGNRRRCPYLSRGRCLAYARRALGCRVYFCRPADALAPGQVYEEYHARIAGLHRRFGLPYLYAELAAALAARRT